jgi:hypothetical protein
MPACGKSSGVSGHPFRRAGHSLEFAGQAFLGAGQTFERFRAIPGSFRAFLLPKKEILFGFRAFLFANKEILFRFRAFLFAEKETLFGFRAFLSPFRASLSSAPGTPAPTNRSFFVAVSEVASQMRRPSFIWIPACAGMTIPGTSWHTVAQHSQPQHR